MPYDEKLADRVRRRLLQSTDFEEKKMFGGVGFMINGNMTVGIIRDDLIVRVGSDRHATALRMPGARPFDMTGRPMSGWVMVSRKGYATDRALEKWIRLALEFVQTLPSK